MRARPIACLLEPRVEEGSIFWHGVRTCACMLPRRSMQSPPMRRWRWRRCRRAPSRCWARGERHGERGERGRGHAACMRVHAGKGRRGSRVWLELELELYAADNTHLISTIGQASLHHHACTVWNKADNPKDHLLPGEGCRPLLCAAAAASSPPSLRASSRARTRTRCTSCSAATRCCAGEPLQSACMWPACGGEAVRPAACVCVCVHACAHPAHGHVGWS